MFHLSNTVNFANYYPTELFMTATAYPSEEKSAYEFLEFPAYPAYPVIKYQRLDNHQAAPIVPSIDPDMYYDKCNDDVYSHDHTVTVSPQRTDAEQEYTSFESSPDNEHLFTCFSEMMSTPTPQLPSLPASRKVSNDQFAERFQAQEFKSSADVMKSLEKGVSSDDFRLMQAIERVLQGSITPATRLEDLNEIQEAIVRAISTKKSVNVDAKKAKGKKREEEKQKFFFKGVLKHTETRFFGKDVQKKRTKKNDIPKDAYYSYYFGEVAQDSGLDISNFYHPNKKSSKTTAQISSAQNPGLKSLNTTYIDLILSSDKFKADTIDYLDNVFMQEAKNARTKKIGKLLVKLTSLIKDLSKKSAQLPIEKQLEAIKTKVHDYIVVNPKSKLPWNDSELLETRDFAYGILLRQSVKGMKQML